MFMFKKMDSVANVSSGFAQDRSCLCWLFDHFCVMNVLMMCVFRVALQFVHELQVKALKNYEASRDRSLPVFGVGVAFVDESAAYPALSGGMSDAIEWVRSTVLSLSPPEKDLHVVPIESVFGSESVEARDRLVKLLDSVSDETGKEDLLLHLKMLSLQKVCLAVTSVFFCCLFYLMFVDDYFIGCL